MTDIPIRFTVMTFNIWGTDRWPERKDAFEQFFTYHQPDILCLQEFSPETRDVLDSLLPEHERVDDTFQGWISEGNIYFNTTLFEAVEYGAEDVGLLEEDRRLFWVRLRPRFSTESKIFAATAHYTYAGHPVETAGGGNPRLVQARNTLRVIQELTAEDEAVLFMGDLNEPIHPIQVFREGGLCDSFNALGRHTRFTHPASPTYQTAPQSLDWIFHRGPIRPMTSEVVDFYHNDLAPSDHKAVLATYQLL